MSTPLMRQYSGLKAKYPGTILLFRLGDFYETFEEDAKTASRVLGITLTRRGNGGASDIPLAGFPHHALESYLPKLLAAGLKVALCEQLEDPKFAKGIVKRDVVEVITPGVAFSEALLPGKRNNFIAAIASAPARGKRSSARASAGGNNSAASPVGVAFADVTTGRFEAADLPAEEIPRFLGSLQPAEILVRSGGGGAAAVSGTGGGPASAAGVPASAGGAVTTELEEWVFEGDYGRDLLLKHFGVPTLKGYGLESSPGGTAAAGALLHYLNATQKSRTGQLTQIRPIDLADRITLDASTMRNLGITGSDRAEGMLFPVIDRTRTPMGGRMLREWVFRPLRTLGPIMARQRVVTAFVEEPGTAREAASILGSIGDLERIIARVCTQRATPREAATLGRHLQAAGRLKSLLSSCRDPLPAVAESLGDFAAVISLIERTLADDPPSDPADGGVIRDGVDAELDRLRGLSGAGKEWLAALQQSERAATGISSLKVGYNSVFGYYIEVTNPHREKVPAGYIRKQTLTNAERYVTPDLKEWEEKILSAGEKIRSLESTLFRSLLDEVAGSASGVQAAAGVIASLDCALSLAEAAAEHGYVKPELDESEDLEIRGGRHPVIEKVLPAGEAYTPNDAVMGGDNGRMFIVSGPNMSGKSSYLRQTGLIVLLAQIGGYVPAASARIGIADAIYTRVGASDNIAAGESTFLVEMQEAANIANTATSRSLVLLDEIGRGTSTFDGLSIAWALTEHLHDRIGCRTLFATHYHELSQLADTLPAVRNYQVEVREYGDHVLFLHKVSPGSADHSYGIHVGRMAGLPKSVTDRAAVILKNLEAPSPAATRSASRATKTKSAAAHSPLPVSGGTAPGLFEGLGDRLGEAPADARTEDPLRERLRAVDIDTLTPLEALKLLSDLKNET